MTKALISKIEPREQGYRVAQIAEDNAIFGVAEDLMWVDCPSTTLADQYWYNPVDGSFNSFAIKIIPNSTTTSNSTTTPNSTTTS